MGTIDFFEYEDEEEGFKYIIDWEPGEMLFVWGNKKKGWVQLAFWAMDFARENAHRFSLINFLIVQRGTIANILDAYEEWDEEERREIQKEMIELLEEPWGYIAN